MFARRIAVILCLAVVLLAALAHDVTGHPFAFLIPVWLFFAAIVSIPIPSIDEQKETRQLSVLPVFSPRPPPVR